MGPRLGARLRASLRRLATTLAAAALAASLAVSLAACGGDHEGSSPQPGDSTTAGGDGGDGSAGSPEAQPEGPVEHDLLTVVSRTLGGGTVDERAVDLTEPGGVEELVAGLEAGMPAQVRRAVRRDQRRPAVQEALAGGAGLYGAVVWIGCETPDEIAVRSGDAGLEVRAVVKSRGTVQCLAPVTSVAVFTA